MPLLQIKFFSKTTSSVILILNALHVFWISLYELGDFPSHKIGHKKKQSLIKWKWHVRDWAQAGPEGTIKLPEQVAYTPPVSTPGSSSIHIHSPIGEFLITSWVWRKKISPDLQIVKQYSGTNWKRQSQHYSSTQNYTPQRQNFE